MSGRLEGKITLVTGAATGLGAATAIRFAEEGATVILTDVNGGRVEETAAEIRERGLNAQAQPQDVTEEASWDRIISGIIASYGKLDVLVNNAGIVIPGNAEETTLSDWQKTQAVNSDAVFLGTRAAIRAMKEGQGSIINISSIEGIVGEAGAAAYNASKGAVRIFTKSAALHCARQGYKIRVNSVHPGFILTELVEGALSSMTEEEAITAGARLLEAIPMGAMGEPVDIANGCLFLASDESKYMTGSELVIDGGYTAH